MRGKVGTDIGIKLLPVMWVFLCIPRHIHCLHSVMHISLSELVSCAFSTIPICPFFNSKNFSFTCLHSFFTCLKQIACSFPNVGGEYNL